MRRATILSLICFLLIGLAPVGNSSVETLSLVQVPVSTSVDAQYLLNNFDETHNHRAGWVELLLWPGDAARLAAAGFPFKTIVDDVVARDAKLLGAPGPLVQLPGPDRSDYRTLEDYESEMKALAEKHPKLVKLIRLPEETLEGRRVFGVEIAANVKSRTDGRPYFYVDGVHHAREWPSGEYPMIFAHHLVEGFGKDSRINKLLKNARVQIVPVVNPDGFDYSRDSLVDAQSPADYPLALLGLEAYWRKNRRSLSGVTIPADNRNPDAYGVDPNRNYGFYWGDNIGGSSGDLTSQTYRGDAPFSEAESTNVRHLISTHQVTGVITNHTYGRLVLRPWGHTAADAPNEKLHRALGAQMASAMGGYQNNKGIGLYATTGTTDDWSYSVTGGIGFTFEHGTSFHPPYADSVGREHKGVLEAFMLGAEASADRRNHGVIKGRVVDANGRPVKAKLKISKSFRTPLWEGNPTGKKSIREFIISSLSTRSDGTFEWHVNPSTRPTVAAKGGKERFELLVLTKDAMTAKKIFIRRGQVVDLGDVRAATDALIVVIGLP